MTPVDAVAETVLAHPSLNEVVWAAFEVVSRWPFVTQIYHDALRGYRHE